MQTTTQQQQAKAAIAAVTAVQSLAHQASTVHEQIVQTRGRLAVARLDHTLACATRDSAAITLASNRWASYFTKLLALTRELAELDRELSQLTTQQNRQPS